MSMPIPEQMQAVQLEGAGGPLTIRQVPVPRPGPGEVLVRMAASPINPSDLAFLDGIYGYQKPYPCIPGIEGSGTIVASGAGLLPRLLAGQRVSCSTARTRGGTWAEYMVTSANLCAPLGRSLSLEKGSMLLVNPLTALAFFEICRSGKHAAMVSTAAASTLGRMILKLGLKYGVPIIHVVRRAEQVELLRSLGATYVLQSSAPDFASELRSLSKQLKATLILDAVAGELIDVLVEAAPRGSTVLVYGALSLGEGKFQPGTLLFGNKQIAGFYLENWLAKKNIFQIMYGFQQVQGMAAAELQTSIQKRLPLAKIQEAVAFYKRNMTAGKVLLAIDSKEVPIDQ